MEHEANKRKKTMIILIAIIVVLIAASVILQKFIYDYPSLMAILPFLHFGTFGCIIGLILTLVKNANSARMNNYNTAHGKEDFIPGMNLSEPVFSGLCPGFRGDYKFYANTEGFYLTNPVISLRYSDIYSMQLFHFTSHRNMIALAAAASRPLISYENGLIVIGDISYIKIKTVTGESFTTCPLQAKDATMFVNRIMSNNPNIQWLGEYKFR